MSNRYITIPDDVVLADAEGQTIVVPGDVNKVPPQSPQLLKATFRALLRERTGDSLHFGQDVDGLVDCVSIRAKFADKKPGDVVEITEAEWTRLTASFRTPSVPYSPDLITQAMTFINAVLSAPMMLVGAPQQPKARTGTGTGTGIGKGKRGR